MNEEIIKEKFKKNYFGIFVNKDRRSKYNIRLRPWVAFPLDDKLKEEFKYEMFSYGISCVLLKNGIRIQGIQNCSMALRFMHKPPRWWRYCLDLMNKGEHNTRDGILEIVRLRNKNSKGNIEPKWNLNRLAQEMSK